MIDTSRISSGFDVEFHLGNGWFLTALQGLASRNLLIPPGTPGVPAGTVVTVNTVVILFDNSGFDLQVNLTVGIFPVVVQATIALNAAGDTLLMTTNLQGVNFSVPFSALSGLAGAPVLIKLQGDASHEDVIAFLANLDLRASPQNVDPLPAGEHLPRGNTGNAQTILPIGKHVALGVASGTLPRFANDIWHNQLRAEDGSHPFPEPGDRQGNWRSVSMSIVDGRIRAVLRATAEIDTPIIDIIPDPDITVTVDLIPRLENGQLRFELVADTDIDFGVLGDLLAALIGGLIGFIIGLFTGNPIGGAIKGAVIGIIVLEVGEAIVGNVIARQIQAEIDGNPLVQFYHCDNDVIHLATVPDEGQGLNLGFLDALPTSILLATDNPDALYDRLVLIANQYDEITLNGNGFAVEGLTQITERYTPNDALIIAPDTVLETVESLTYQTTDNEMVTLTLQEILDRANTDEVPEPLNMVDPPEPDEDEPEWILSKRDGQIPIACLHPVAVRREDSIVTAIRFETGLELQTQDTIMLQEAGALVLPGLQLIRPVNRNPYYRSPADDTTANNFENLPEF